MKFFLDTANPEEIRQAASFGILDGITTNPTLAAKEKKPFRELILEICEIVKNGVVNAISKATISPRSNRASPRSRSRTYQTSASEIIGMS